MAESLGITASDMAGTEADSVSRQFTLRIRWTADPPWVEVVYSEGPPVMSRVLGRPARARPPRLDVGGGRRAFFRRLSGGPALGEVEILWVPSVAVLLLQLSPVARA